MQQYVDRLSTNFKDCQILLSGYQVVAQEVDPPENISILRSLDQALDFLEGLKRRN